MGHFLKVVRLFILFEPKTILCLSMIGVTIAPCWGQTPQIQTPNVYQQLFESASPEIKDRIRTLQEEGRQKGWTFPIGVTGVSDKSIEELTGGQPPTAEMIAAIPQINMQSASILDAYNAQLKATGIPQPASACSTSQGAMDWRTQGKVTPVTSQACGNCWAFSTTAQTEAAFLMNNYSVTELSEQQLLDCSHAEVNASDCSKGGYQFKALTYGQF